MELTGTIDGAKFTATMDKDRQGRTRVRFEGLRFDDEQEMRDFVAPLDAATLQEFKLDGSVAGRRIRDVWDEPARPGKALELSLNFRTLAHVEARLLGVSGLVRGARPFEAEFKGLSLTGQEILRLSTLIRDALASPAGSEVTLTGMIDSAKFEATMDKDREGRARVRFEGLTFNDERDMREFVAPLETESTKGVPARGFCRRSADSRQTLVRGAVLFSPIDCILDESTIVQLAFVYLNPARAGLGSWRGIEGPPTLIVEILSLDARRGP